MRLTCIQTRLKTYPKQIDMYVEGVFLIFVTCARVEYLPTVK